MTRTSPSIAARALCWVLVLLGAATVASSRHWIDASFPGFFLMPNRVVPSAGLPGWAGGRDGRPVYHHVLLAVDGVEVDRAEMGYRLAATGPIGRNVEYTFVRDGEVERRTLPVVRFGWSDYVGVFGAYALTGLAYLVLAFVSVRSWGQDERHVALAAFAWAGAVYSFTGIDLYGAGGLFRLHVAAEVFLAAGAAHVALVCPRPAFPTVRGAPIAVYGTAAMLTLVYQIFLYEPRAYSAIHNLAQGLVGLPIFVLAGRFALALGEASGARLRQALQLQLGGILVGLVAPAIVFAVSSLAGGDVPVSTAAWLNFVFPFAFAAGVLLVSRDAPVPSPSLA